jgi:hypothetical protein
MVSWDTRMLSFWGYRIFSHLEICSGDQSRISFTGNDRSQLHMDGKKARLGSQSRLPGLMICFIGSIEWTPAVARHLPAHRLRSPLQPLAISRIDEPGGIPREMSSRSASVSVRSQRRRAAGTIPPRCDNKN